MSTIGDAVLHYSVLGPLGAGGMGVVYRALDTRLDRTVALKFLPESLAVDQRAKERLTLEARAAAKLDHPNIGVIHDIEEADGRVFIVMALYEGESVNERLAREPLPVSDALGLGLQAARGLASAHDKGLVHRDIKPANLFLTRDGLVKILDFGLVKLDQAEGLTMPGTIVGTPEYMAPEQIRGQAVDRRADLWALGAVLYEMLTNVSPFRANGQLSTIILEVMNGTPAPVSELRPEAPAGLDRVLERALARDPDERYQYAEELVADLEELLGAAAPATGTAGPPNRSPIVGQGGDSSAGVAVPGRAEAGSLDSLAALSIERVGSARASALLEPVPRVSGFIGREETLEDLRQRIGRERVVAIRGMAGTGKTLLGSRLAGELAAEEDVFWFTFDPVEKNTVDALFWSLAAFLQSRGETLLWRYMQSEIEAHKALDMTVRVNLFMSSLTSRSYVFCFDDVHLVKDSPEVAELLKTLRRQISREAGEHQVAFILMGRELPGEVDIGSESLAGFSAEETAALLESHRLQGLADELVRRLYERTAGNPTILDLAATALDRLGKDQRAQADFIEAMAGRSDIRDYVMRHIYSDLPASEKSVLDALSIFSGSVELEVAEETLSAGGVESIMPCVDSLIQKAIVHETANGQIYCHELVRDFCYRSLDRRSKRELHEHAARHYQERRNILRAAHHYFELGQAETALELLTSNVETIIQAGGSASLIDQLTRYDLSQLSEEQQMAAYRALGEAHFIRGQFRSAVGVYQQALDDAFEEEDQADILCRLASTYDKLGEHERAVEFAGRSLESYEMLDDARGEAEVRRVLGWAHYRLGRLEEAEAAFQAGRLLAEELNEQSLLAQVDQGLGVIDLRSGRLEQARQRLDASRRAFRQKRNRIGEAEATGNLAWVYGKLGDIDRELSLDRKVLEILESVGDVGNLMVAYNNTGDLYFRSGRHQEAIEQYEKLAALASRIDHTIWSVAANLGLAENRLAVSDIEGALVHAQKGYQMTAEIGDRQVSAVERALSARVLGEVTLALDLPEEAQRWFQESIEPLERASEEEELSKARRGLEAAVARLRDRGAVTGTGEPR